jgi:hypothetical protein
VLRDDKLKDDNEDELDESTLDDVDESAKLDDELVCTICGADELDE